MIYIIKWAFSVHCSLFGFVKRAVSRVKRFVKRVVRKAVKVVKKACNKYVGPWIKLIIKVEKKIVLFASSIISGVKNIRKGWKCIKNTYKTLRNFITNGPYKKYWEKAKNNGKAAFKQVKKYVVNSTPFKKRMIYIK